MSEFQGLIISKGAYEDVSSYLSEHMNHASKDTFISATLSRMGCTLPNCPGCPCSECLFFVSNDSALKKWIAWQIRRIKNE